MVYIAKKITEFEGGGAHRTSLFLTQYESTDNCASDVRIYVGGTYPKVNSAVPRNLEKRFDVTVRTDWIVQREFSRV
jgi:hypothetical protein